MKNLQAWFEKGLTFEEYVAGMKVLKEEMLHIHSHFALTLEHMQSLESTSAVKKVIALTEDWCGDAMLNNPILVKIAEAQNWNVRFLLRDSNLELMDQYLTNGTSRAIPIYIFLDEAGNELAVWGPRADQAQQMVEEGRAKLPNIDAEDFKDKQAEFYKQLMQTYREDTQLWYAVTNSIIAKIQSNV